MLHSIVSNVLHMLRPLAESSTRNLDARTILGYSTADELYQAAIEGNTDKLRALVGGGVSVDKRLTRNYTALMVAAKAGHTNTVRVLAEVLKADVNARGLSGETALMLAAAAGKTNTVRTLVRDLKANVNAKASKGEDALLMAAVCGHTDTMRALNAEGASVNTRDKKRMTPLFYKSVVSNSEMMHALLHAGADPNARDVRRRTPLFAAAAWGTPNTVRMLMERNAEVNAHDEILQTPLFEAAWTGNASVVPVLVREFSADPDRKNVHCETPFLFTATNNQAETMRELYSAIQLTVTPDELLSALQVAAEKGHTDIIRVLLDECGADVNARLKDGQTPLHMALVCRHWDTARALISEFHADVNARDANGKTPLWLAASAGQIEIMRELAGRGADANAPDIAGEAILQRPLLNGDVATVWTLLRECGAAPVVRWDTSPERSLAMASGTHRRLGRNAPTRNISPEVMEMLMSHLDTPSTPQKPLSKLASRAGHGRLASVLKWLESDAVMTEDETRARPARDYCPVCLAQKKPEELRALVPCGHPLCIGCCEHISSQPQTFKCPSCRQEVLLHVDPASWPEKKPLYARFCVSLEDRGNRPC